jgi:hypothetical protein
MPVKLGKRAARFDPRTLKMARYIEIAGAPPAPPLAIDWLANVSSWPMYMNDVLGDCVEAAGGHMVELWEKYTNSNKPQPTNSQIVQAYSGAGGYVPGDPSTDQGTDMLSFLKYWRSTGIGGHKILAFVSLKRGDLAELRQAIWLFGAAIIGVQLPVSVQNLNEWSVPDGLSGDYAPGSWGGHCVPVGAYNEQLPGRLRNKLVTWGSVIPMSDYFYYCYCDEAYAVLSQDWIDTNGLAPNLFDLDLLQSDLAAL